MVDSGQGTDELQALRSRVAELEHIAQEAQCAREALRESEDRFRALADSIPGAVFSYDVNSASERTPLYVGPGFDELIGRTAAAEIVGGSVDRFFELIHPDDLDALRRAGEFEPDFAEAVDNEYRVRTESGTYRWIRAIARPTHLSNGNLRWHGVLIDIHDRKAAADALWRSELQHRMLLRRLPVGVFRSTVAGKMLAGNAALVRMLGAASEAELLQVPASNFWCDPTRREELIAHVATHGSMTNYELKFRRLDGSTGLAIISVHLVRDAEGNPIALEGIANDITEHRLAKQELNESEARYRAIVEDQTELISRHRDNGLLTFVNGALAEFVGKPKAELLGRSFFPFLPNEDCQRLIDQLADLTPAHPIDTIEHRVELPNGELRWLQWINRAIYDRNGRFIEYQSVGRDITEQKRAEEKREQLESQLRQSHKLQAVGQLAAGIAHDFNSLLMVILGNTELVRNRLNKHGSQGAGCEALPALDEILRSVGRGRELIQKLLAFGRIRSRRSQSLNLNRIITQTHDMLKGLIAKQIKFEINKAPRLHRFHGEAGQIEQVIVNLVLNACDAMPDGGTLTIETRNVTLTDKDAVADAEARPGPYVMLEVKDTGRGMTKETLDRIFEPFFSDKPVNKGSGLGLSIVHGIVRQTEGHVRVQSEPGKGTTFRLYFPAVDHDGHKTG